jgi:hypothetical protein
MYLELTAYSSVLTVTGQETGLPFTCPVPVIGTGRLRNRIIEFKKQIPPFQTVPTCFTLF